MPGLKPRPTAAYEARPTAAYQAPAHCCVQSKIHGNASSVQGTASRASGRTGGRRRAVRRHQRRRGAHAGGRQAAQLSSCLSRGARAPGVNQSVLGCRLRLREAELRSAEVRGAARRGRRAERVFLSAANGLARADGPGGVLLARRIRRRRHPEAREDAEGQGRRPHASHARTRRPDRTGVPDVHGGARDRRARGVSNGGTAALRLHGRGRRAAHDLARVRRHRGGPRCGDGPRAAALYRRRPPSRGVGLPHARGAAETWRESARGRHVPGRRVPARPGADPRLQPAREGPRTAISVPGN